MFALRTAPVPVHFISHWLNWWLAKSLLIIAGSTWSDRISPIPTSPPIPAWKARISARTWFYGGLWVTLPTKVDDVDIVWNCQTLKLFNTRDEPTEMYAKTCTTKNLVPWGKNTMVKRFPVFHWKPQSIILSYRTGPQNSYSYNHQVPWSYCKSQVSHMFASTHFHDTRVAPKASQSWPIRTYSLQAALMASRVPPKVRKTLT